MLGVREPWGDSRGEGQRTGQDRTLLTRSIFNPQMGICKVESPPTAPAPAAPLGTGEAAVRAEGPSLVATAQNRPLEAFQHPVLEEPRAGGGGKSDHLLGG